MWRCFLDFLGFWGKQRKKIWENGWMLKFEFSWGRGMDVEIQIFLGNMDGC